MVSDSFYSFTSLSQIETELFGEKFAESLVEGDIVLLNGNLGAGKTALARGIAKGLHGTCGDVKSPSYTLLNIYEGEPALYHFDFYRIEEGDDITELGLDDYWGKGVSIVEWPKSFCENIQGRKIEITIETIGGNKRKIKINREENV